MSYSWNKTWRNYKFAWNSCPYILFKWWMKQQACQGWVMVAFPWRVFCDSMLVYMSGGMTLYKEMSLSVAGKRQCLIQLSSMPIAVCHGSGSTPDEARVDAALNALQYLLIMTEKWRIFHKSNSQAPAAITHPLYLLATWWQVFLFHTALFCPAEGAATKSGPT